MQSPRVSAILEKILNTIGIKSIEDTTSIASTNCFDLVSADMIDKLVTEYRLSYVVGPLDSERKLEIVNRVLELKHGMIIDSIKEIDNEPSDVGTVRELVGYKLEKMPSGY